MVCISDATNKETSQTETQIDEQIYESCKSCHDTLESGDFLIVHAVIFLLQAHIKLRLI